MVLRPTTGSEVTTGAEGCLERILTPGLYPRRKSGGKIVNSKNVMLLERINDAHCGLVPLLAISVFLRVSALLVLKPP